MKKSISLGLALAVLLLMFGVCSLAEAVEYDPAYDLTRDGRIDFDDLSKFANKWLYDCSAKDCYGTDFVSNNNSVDFVDYSELAEHWMLEFPGDMDLSWEYVINQGWEGGSRPSRLDDFVNVHPRLLLTQAKVNELKTKIGSGTHKDMWLVIKGKADAYLGDNPNNNPGSESATRSDGDVVPWLALAYLMTDNSAYLNKAISWMTTVCSYTEWDGDRSLGAGHCLMGISVAYDWLCNYMTDAQKEDILFGTSGTRGLTYFADRMAATSYLDSPKPQHRERYLTNHCQVEYAGLAAAGFALYDDDVNAPDAEDWMRMAYNIFDMAFKVSGNDGGNTEGHQYYGLMIEFQMHFNKMAKELMDRDFYQESKWLQNMGYFILYSTLPNFSSSDCVMRFGDTKNYDYVGHGPIYQLFNVASEYGDGYLQWLALEMFDRGIGTTHRMGWANLLWYDEAITPASWSGLPRFRRFEDTGWITSRSEWTNDAIMVGFKCGPMHGHKVQPYYDKQVDENWPATMDPNMDELYGMKYHQMGGGHGHPDVCHFSVYGFGEWLAVDDGYSKPKYTHLHNTILVNGDGQLGESYTGHVSSWFQRQDVIDAKAKSTIVKWENRTDYDYIIGDAENIYRDPNLTGFRRHFVYIKPDIIVIVDELESTVSTSLEWRLHVGDLVSGSGDNYTVSNGTVRMDVHFAYPGSITTGVSGTVLSANLTSTGSDLLVSVLHPRRSTDDVSSITFSSFNGSVVELTIQVGAEVTNVEIDLSAQEADIS